MRRLQAWEARGLCCVLALGLGSCLPKDTRPTPGTLHVTVTGDESLRSGFDTDDGWHIRYQRFLMTIGRVSIMGNSCNEYSEGGGDGYSRILDLLQPGPQKLTVLYAIGGCEFEFRIGNPAPGSVLGEGVTEADKTFFRTPGSDAYVKDGGVTAQIEGTATQGGRTKRFNWVFRRSASYTQCSVGDAGPVGFVFRGGHVDTADIGIDGKVLFADGADPHSASLRFEPFATADEEGNADGEISLDELSAIPESIPVLLSPDAGVADAGTSSTLEEALYLGLVPRIVRFEETGMCTVGDRFRR